MRRLIVIVSATAVALALVALLAACGAPVSIERTVEETDASAAEEMATEAEPMDRTDGPPPMTIDVSKTYLATFTMEGGATFEIELFADKAPITVNNFVTLAQRGYFDGTTFHRVIPGFMSQAGDPTGTGSGGPGYAFENEFHPDARHDTPGIVSMANAGIRNGKATNGSQFFIIHEPQPHLDGVRPDGSPRTDCAEPMKSCHSVFGKVTTGLSVVTGMTPRNPQQATSPGDRIESVVITVR